MTLPFSRLAASPSSVRTAAPIGSRGGARHGTRDAAKPASRYNPRPRAPGSAAEVAAPAPAPARPTYPAVTTILGTIAESHTSLPPQGRRLAREGMLLCNISVEKFVASVSTSALLHVTNPITPITPTIDKSCCCRCTASIHCPTSARSLARVREGGGV